MVPVVCLSWPVVAIWVLPLVRFRASRPSRYFVGGALERPSELQLVAGPVHTTSSSPYKYQASSPPLSPFKTPQACVQPQVDPGPSLSASESTIVYTVKPNLYRNPQPQACARDARALARLHGLQCLFACKRSPHISCRLICAADVSHAI